VHSGLCDAPRRSVPSGRRRVALVCHPLPDGAAPTETRRDFGRGVRVRVRITRRTRPRKNRPRSFFAVSGHVRFTSGFATVYSPCGLMSSILDTNRDSVQNRGHYTAGTPRGLTVTFAAGRRQRSRTT